MVGNRSRQDGWAVSRPPRPAAVADRPAVESEGGLRRRWRAAPEAGGDPGCRSGKLPGHHADSNWAAGRPSCRPRPSYGPTAGTEGWCQGPTLHIRHRAHRGRWPTSPSAGSEAPSALRSAGPTPLRLRMHSAVCRAGVRLPVLTRTAGRPAQDPHHACEERGTRVRRSAPRG